MLSSHEYVCVRYLFVCEISKQGVGAGLVEGLAYLFGTSLQEMLYGFIYKCVTT